MSDLPADDELGLKQPITRRDFLNGIALSTVALSAAPLRATAADPPAPAADSSPAGLASSAAPRSPDNYPPLLTGLRGSHPGSFEAAHALRDGTAPGPALQTGEEYDLIVVGGGISGLAAAHFYRARAGAGSRILILDNHDDFGGHAKRNEFELAGRMHLMNGGTLEIDSPRPYSPVAAGLLEQLGLDVARLARKIEDADFYQRHGLAPGVFFDRETFGADRLVVGFGGWYDHPNRATLERVLASAPLSAQARADVIRLQTEHHDYLPQLDGAQKKDHLSRVSYERFLREIARVDESVVKLYHARTLGEWGVGTDAVSALDCWGFGMPGFQGMGLPKGSIARMGYTPAGYEDTGGSLRLHFPDGNATIARLLVRDLVPRAYPQRLRVGRVAEDIVAARIDYSQLDLADSPVRVRLSSTALRVRPPAGAGGSSRIEVLYAREGRTYATSARGVVLACYNMMIPYLCPELPEAQKQALHSLVKTPLVYTSVAVRNWRSFERLGVHHVYAPGGYHSYFNLNPHVDVGAYRSVGSPDEPILVHMVRTPCKAGLPEHEQNRAGRAELLGTSFETFEREIRQQLNRTLAPGGFDAARDITAITVNRWPHGYAAEYNPLFDPDVLEAQRAHVRGRAPFGRITIANSDAGGAAYTDSAIDQAHRAVLELL
ncbi:MAG TPA: NAD(P)-binding protein [Steroidobacteraceae bacterium]|nr:NAD(P)-binding protein [Steroidobacteraceae bacterium]